MAIATSQSLHQYSTTELCRLKQDKNQVRIFLTDPDDETLFCMVCGDYPAALAREFLGISAKTSARTSRLAPRNLVLTSQVSTAKVYGLISDRKAFSSVLAWLRSYCGGEKKMPLLPDTDRLMSIFKMIDAAQVLGANVIVEVLEEELAATHGTPKGKSTVITPIQATCLLAFPEGSRARQFVVEQLVSAVTHNNPACALHAGHPELLALRDHDPVFSKDFMRGIMAKECALADKRHAMLQAQAVKQAAKEQRRKANRKQFFVEQARLKKERREEEKKARAALNADDTRKKAQANPKRTTQYKYDLSKPISSKMFGNTAKIAIHKDADKGGKAKQGSGKGANGKKSA